MSDAPKDHPPSELGDLPPDLITPPSWLIFKIHPPSPQHDRHHEIVDIKFNTWITPEKLREAQYWLGVFAFQMELRGYEAKRKRIQREKVEAARAAIREVEDLELRSQLLEEAKKELP